VRLGLRALRLVFGCLVVCAAWATAEKSAPLVASGPPVATVTARQPGSWLEVTPLGSFEPARLIERAGSSAPVRLDHWKAGLALVCAGGDGVAVACEQRYLEAAPVLSPELQNGARITGVVLVGSAPASNARVALVPQRLTSRRLLTLPLALDRRTKTLLREVRTDRAGRFTTPELAPGEYQLEINTPEGLIHHGEPFALPPREALLPKGAKKPEAEAVFDLGQIVLPGGVRVEIGVHDAAGLPMAGAKVGGGQGERPESRRFFETVTDAQGKAVLSGLDPAEAASFVCVVPGYSDVRQRFATLPLSVDCAMRRLARLEGRVLDGDGEPLAGAMLSLAGRHRSVPADKDGSFSLQDLEPGPYRLVAAAPGFRPARRDIGLAAGERRKLSTIELQPGREIRGYVRDARSKEGLAGASLSSVDPPGAIATTTAEDGSFQLGTDDTERMAVEVSAAGYPATTAEVPSGADGRAPWVIELTPGGRIRAEVWDEEADGPCQGCSLTLTPAGGPSQSIATDGEGVAVSEPLAEGTYMVTPTKVQSLGWVVQVSGGREIKTVQVVSGETATVHFGERRRRVVVRLHPQAPGWLLSMEAKTRSGAADPLPDGSFLVAKPQGEAVSLTLVRGRENVALGVLPADDDRTAFDIDVPQTEVRGALAGKVLPEGVRLVSASDPSVYASSAVPPDGSFTIPFLPPGVYALVVNGRAIRSLSVETGVTTNLGRIELN